jgi:hypothetical protein
MFMQCGHEAAHRGATLTCAGSGRRCADAVGTVERDSASDRYWVPRISAQLVLSGSAVEVGATTAVVGTATSIVAAESPLGLPFVPKERHRGTGMQGDAEDKGSDRDDLKVDLARATVLAMRMSAFVTFRPARRFRATRVGVTRDDGVVLGWRIGRSLCLTGLISLTGRRTTAPRLLGSLLVPASAFRARLRQRRLFSRRGRDGLKLSLLQSGPSVSRPRLAVARFMALPGNRESQPRPRCSRADGFKLVMPWLGARATSMPRGFQAWVPIGSDFKPEPRR